MERLFVCCKCEFFDKEGLGVYGSCNGNGEVYPLDIVVLDCKCYRKVDTE